MANVIKHKRGTSDPTASDLVVGEVAIRTDVGKLFTKMDNGSVAEIAGGGSDIIINTLSSSSATGGGSATFNGSAYRFTLSQPPSVSAQQLLVSIAGVVQKPIAGTGQPSEGFSINGNDIILAAAPATGTDFFILTFKSLGVSEPADNTVTSAKIVDGTIVNADINASAAIAGSKISPDFGSQNITTTGDFTITSAVPKISLVDSGNDPDYEITNTNGSLNFKDTTNNATRISIQSSATTIANNLDCASGIDVTGAITGTGDLTIDTNTLHVDSSNNRVGIGIISPAAKFHVSDGTPRNTAHNIFHHTATTGTDNDGEVLKVISSRGTGNNNPIFNVLTNTSTSVLAVTGAGNVGINQVPTRELSLHSPNNNNALIHFTNDDTGETSADGILVGLDGNENMVINNQETGKTINFYNGGSQRMSIDSSGKVIVKTNGLKLENATATNSRTFSITNAAGTTGWSFGNGVIASAHQFVIYDNTAGAARMLIDSSGNVEISDGNLKVASGHGIDFSATSDASGKTSELLDDYEEGTWTPTIAGSSGNPTISYVLQRGYYSKIGSQVTLWFDIAWQSKSGGSGNLQIKGIPINTGSTYYHGFGTLSHGTGFTEAAGARGIYANASANFLYIIRTNSNASVVTTNNMANTGHIFGGITYRNDT